MGREDRGARAELLTTLWQLGLVGLTCLVLAMMVMIANDTLNLTSGQPPRPEWVSAEEYHLTVTSYGLVEVAKVVGEETGEEVQEGDLFVSPDAAIEAITGVEVTPHEYHRYNRHVGTPNLAYAHTDRPCVHQDGVVSMDTGGSRHVSSFRKHDNGRHYSKGYHQHLTYWGWQTDDVFYWSARRSYCGCW